MGRVACLFAGLFCGAALSGCGANFNSVYRHQSLDGARATATMLDAKQRVVLTSTAPYPENESSTAPDGKSTFPPVRRIFCAEPSPDALVVMAQAVSGTGSFGRTADPKAVQAAASMAYSSAEQGSVIPRTQAINLIREVMYRSCERYLDGAIGTLEMPIQAVRDQRMMVSLLAIEQLTNATRPVVVSIGANSTGSAGSSNADAVVRLNDAYKTLDATTKTQLDRQSDYDKLNKGSPSCDDIKKTVAAGNKVSTDDQAKQTQCSNAQTALDAANKDKDDASARVQKLSGLAGGGAGPATTGDTTQSAAYDQDKGAAQAQATEAVAKVVKNIVERTFNQDEFLLFCMKVLSPESNIKDADHSITQMCGDYVKAGINRSIVEIKKDTLSSIDAVTQETDRFSGYWNKTSSEKMASIALAKNRYPKSATAIDRLSRAITPADAQKIFDLLATEAQIILAN